MRGWVGRWWIIGIGVLASVGCDDAEMDRAAEDQAASGKADALGEGLELPSSCQEAGERGDCGLFGQCRSYAGECVDDPCWTRTTDPFHIVFQDPLTGVVYGSCGDPEPTSLGQAPSCATIDEYAIASIGLGPRDRIAPDPDAFVSASGVDYGAPEGWGARKCCKARGGIDTDALCGLPLAE